MTKALVERLLACADENGFLGYLAMGAGPCFAPTWNPFTDIAVPCEAWRLETTFRVIRTMNSGAPVMQVSTVIPARQGIGIIKYIGVMDSPERALLIDDFSDLGDWQSEAPGFPAIGSGPDKPVAYLDSALWTQGVYTNAFYNESLGVNASGFGLGDYLQFFYKVDGGTIESMEVRFGNDPSNYWKWTVDVSTLYQSPPYWNHLSLLLSEGNPIGNPSLSSQLNYFALRTVKAHDVTEYIDRLRLWGASGVMMASGRIVEFEKQWGEVRTIDVLLEIGPEREGGQNEQH